MPDTLNFKILKGAAKKQVKIKHQNHRGDISIRTILPRKVWYEKTKWHPEEQWFLNALCVTKNDSRDFAMNDILEWGIK